MATTTSRLALFGFTTSRASRLLLATLFLFCLFDKPCRSSAEELTSTASPTTAEKIPSVLLPINDDDDLVRCHPNNGTKDIAFDVAICGKDRYCAFADTDYDEGYFCLHKAFFPLEWNSDVVALVVTVLIAFVSGIAGIGGGGMVLPCVVLFLNLTPKEATVISNSAVVGNGLAQIILNYVVNKKDYITITMVMGTVIVMLPGILAGALAMVSLEALVPSTVILILAFVTLFAASCKSFDKARQQYLAEQTEEKPNDMSTEQPSDEATLLLEQKSQQDYQAMSSKEVTDLKIHHQEELQDDLHVWWINNRTQIFVFILLAWCISTTSNEITDLFSVCSFGFFFFVFLPTFVYPLIYWQSSKILKTNRLFYGDEMDKIVVEEDRQSETTESDDSKKSEDDREIDVAANAGDTCQQQSSTTSKQFNVLVWWLPFAAFSIGALAALLGIGGGELNGPVLLILNMDPKYSSTTTGTLAFINAFTNSLYDLGEGRLQISPWYNGSFMLAGAIGGGSGRVVATFFMNNSQNKRRWIIASSLALVLLIASALIVEELFTSTVSWTSEDLCST